jgi:hypothetical protein
VDAIIARISPGDADAIELKLVQLKSGAGGLTAREIARLKEAVPRLSKDWLLAAFDGNTLHILPEIPCRAPGKPVRNEPLQWGAKNRPRPSAKASGRPSVSTSS